MFRNIRDLIVMRLSQVSQIPNLVDALRNPYETFQLVVDSADWEIQELSERITPIGSIQGLVYFGDVIVTNTSEFMFRDEHVVFSAHNAPKVKESRVTLVKKDHKRSFWVLPDKFLSDGRFQHPTKSEDSDLFLYGKPLTQDYLDKLKAEGHDTDALRTKLFTSQYMGNWDYKTVEKAGSFDWSKE